MQSRSTDQCSLTSDMRGSMVTRGNLLLLLLCAVPSPGLGGHGFPHFSVFRCSYHFRFLYIHPFTEALCIDNSLSSYATLSFDFATYAKAFYFFISHYMSKEAHLSASYRNY